MSTSFTLDRTGIIRNAYQLVGILDAGSDPTTPQLALGADLLQLRTTELQSRGIILTQLSMVTTPLVTGQAEYATDADTLDIDGRTPFVTTGTGTTAIDLPLTIISRGMYDRLTIKNTQSQPSQMYVQRSTAITFFLYPVPDASWVSVTYPKIVIAPDMSTGASTTGLRSKYLRCLVLGVAADLAFNTGFLDRQAALSAEFERAVEMAVNDDNERGSVKFTAVYGPNFSRRW
jgi:hypothetical protein